jgi:hypothetical protein
MKQLKLVIAVCFVVSMLTAVFFNADGGDDQKNIGAIGWLILAAACMLSYTRIMIEESRNKNK